jgi:hypothetical protein
VPVKERPQWPSQTQERLQSRSPVCQAPNEIIQVLTVTSPGPTFHNQRSCAIVGHLGSTKPSTLTAQNKMR